MVLRERNATPEDLPVVELFWDGFQNGAKGHPTGISRLQMIGPIEALQVPTFQIEFYIVTQFGVVATVKSPNSPFCWRRGKSKASDDC
jgi:hypothetical protein